MALKRLCPPTAEHFVKSDVYCLRILDNSFEDVVVEIV